MKHTATEWYRLFCSEARRCRAPEPRRASIVVEYVGPRAPVKREPPQRPPMMPLPPCLCRPDTEAGRERRAVVLRRDFWLRRVDHLGLPVRAARINPLFE